MNASSQPSAGQASVWTCPFCPLLCDDLKPETVSDKAAAPATRWQLAPDSPVCTLAAERLALTGAPPEAAACSVRGQTADLQAACTAAARTLADARQPLFAGLGADVAASRALYALAARCGAITDVVGGAALAQGLRTQQDRGGFTTTLGEIRERADLVVFVGSWAPARAPRLIPRITHGRAAAPRWATLGCEVPADADVSSADVRAVAAADGLYDAVATLAALVAGKAVPRADADLVALADALRQSPYAVLVWEPAQLGAHGALVIERLNNIVGTLNRTTRAGGFPLGGGDGASTVNQTVTWMSGLPVRTRVTPRGMQHEPLLFDATSVLGGHEADAVLCLSAYGSGLPAAPEGLPRVVIGPPSMAARLGDLGDTIWIPAAMPGLTAAGHLCRTDGVVMLPLHAQADDGLPTPARVIDTILAAMPARAPAGAAGSPV